MGNHLLENGYSLLFEAYYFKDDILYAKAEKTLIEGKIYFDIEKDLEMRKSIQTERTELINMMLNEKNNGAPTQSAKKRVKEALHCDSLD